MKSNKFRSDWEFLVPERFRFGMSTGMFRYRDTTIRFLWKKRNLVVKEEVIVRL